MTGWVVASVALKLCVYLAAAAGIGGGSALALLAVRGGLTPRSRLPGAKGIFSVCLLGIPACAAFFFTRVGEFAEAGPAGMFDPVFVRILWESPVGAALQGRILGFTLLLSALMLLLVRREFRKDSALTGTLLLLFFAAVITSRTFHFTGHSAELGLPGNLAITAHVLATLCWAGALYPLWRATGRLDIKPLQEVLHRFGVLAAGLVSIVLIAGIVLLLLMFLSRTGDISLYYALVFASKLALVVALLLIAALHKWRAVPRLPLPGGLAAFRRSLGLEIAVAFAILVATAVLSTALGPFHGA